MNELFRNSERQSALSQRLNSFKLNGRKWVALCALVSLFLNLLMPASQAMSTSGMHDDLVEICTQTGIKQVSVRDLFPEDTDFGDQENCPVCSDCPLCWQAQSTVILPVKDNWQINIWRYNQAKFGVDHKKIWLSTANAWPESRAPPQA